MNKRRDLSFLNADRGSSKAVVEVVTGKRFDSIKNAANYFGLPRSAVVRSCKAAVVIDPGLKFRYLD